MTFVRMCVGVCVHVPLEIKQGMLRASLMYAFVDVRVWTRKRFDLPDGDFHSKNGVIQYGLLSKLRIPVTNCTDITFGIMLL